MRNSLQQQHVARHASVETTRQIARGTASATEAQFAAGGRSANEANILGTNANSASKPQDPSAAAASVALRQIRADDAAALQDFVRALSPASRRLRFHAALNELSEAMQQALTRVDQREHVALVLTSTEHGSEQIVGEARYVVSDDGETAEFGIAVADAYRGLGLAERLLAALVEAAHTAGLRWLVGDVLAENARMLAFVRRLGFAKTTRGEEPGLIRVERRIARLRRTCAHT